MYLQRQSGSGTTPDKVARTTGAPFPLCFSNDTLPIHLYLPVRTDYYWVLCPAVLRLRTHLGQSTSLQ